MFLKVGGIVEITGVVQSDSDDRSDYMKASLWFYQLCIVAQDAPKRATLHGVVR